MGTTRCRAGGEATCPCWRRDRFLYRSGLATMMDRGAGLGSGPPRRRVRRHEHRLRPYRRRVVHTGPVCAGTGTAYVGIRLARGRTEPPRPVYTARPRRTSMAERIRIGIVGYGNLGRGAEMALAHNPDMQLVGIFTRRDPANISPLGPDVPVHALDTIERF